MHILLIYFKHEKFESKYVNSVKNNVNWTFEVSMKLTSFDIILAFLSKRENVKHKQNIDIDWVSKF